MLVILGLCHRYRMLGINSHGSPPSTA
jgi:hypothetical protein